MKLVQIGILVSLVAIAGLLGAIVVMNYQSSETVQEVAAAETFELDIESTEPVTANPIEPEPPVPAKPKPVRSATAPRQVSAVAPKPVARTEPAPAAEPPEPKPVAQPPLVRSVSPKHPDLVEPVRPIQSVPKPAPVPRQVTLPAGTDLAVRLDFGLSSDRNFTGDSFTASLDRAIVIDDMIIAEKGARVEGRVTEAVRAGRVKGRAELAVELIKLDTADGQTIEIVSNRIHREGPGTLKSDATKVGVGAGVGALIGAIAGGGKGAAIGAGVGAGAGGGAAAVKRGKPVEVPAEERLEFRLMEAVQVVENL